MSSIDEKLQPILASVIRRNAGEAEFHQAVHEVLASARPMLVNFLLPGQEEGNARLLEKLGGGRHVPDARALAAAVREMVEEGGAPWRRMHENLVKAEMTGGSGKIADLVLKLAEERTN